MPDFVIPEKKLKEEAREDDITHLSTGAAVVQNGKILVVRREPDDYLGGVFELPGGGVDEGENLKEAVRREVLEETGLVIDNILAMFPGFDYSTPTKSKVRQLNFLVDAKGYNVKLSGEHDKFEWINEKSIRSFKTTGPMAKCLREAFSVIKL